MSQIKQTQSGIDRFLTELDQINKEFNSLYNSKICFKSKEARDEYDKLHDEIQKKQQEIFEKFRNNRY